MAAPGSRTDAQLVALVATGDVRAFAELYDRHADAVYRAAFRRLGDRQACEEVLQDTFMTLWNRAELFDPRQGSLLTWLSTIARNRAVDQLRHRGRRPSVVPLSAVFPETDDEDRDLARVLGQDAPIASGRPPGDPEALVERADLAQEVRAALAAIPGPEREALELAYYSELTQAEIAQRLGWPLGTVKTRTRRALLRLRAALSESLGSRAVPPPPADRLETALRERVEPELLEVADGPR